MMFKVHGTDRARFPFVILRRIHPKGCAQIAGLRVLYSCTPFELSSALYDAVVYERDLYPNEFIICNFSICV